MDPRRPDMEQGEDIIMAANQPAASKAAVVQRIQAPSSSASLSIPSVAPTTTTTRTTTPSTTTSTTPGPPAKGQTLASAASRPATAASSSSSKAKQRSSFAFPLFQPNTSSTSLAASTAEGKPIPVDDSTAASRTSALREISSNFPAPVRPAQPKSVEAQSGIVSRPVIVRTYSGPPRSRHGSGSRGSSRRRPYYASAAGAYSRASQQSASGSRYGYGIPVVGGLLSMGRANRSKTAGGPAASGAAGAAGPAEGKMPPLEAFTFKGILAKIENDIGGDLDSIAEICARSRLSLSNQYEVHVPPHGSGAAFLQSASSAAVSRRDQRGKHSAANSGPLTLQAVPSDDENNRHASRRRRGGPGRRRSAAMGTLETIMSSSRSSEEGKTNKKPAAEIVEEVRGRHAAAQAKANSGQAKANGHSNSPPSPSSSKSDPDAKAGIAGAGAWHESSSRRKTLAFTAALMMDSTRQHSPGQSSSRESGARDDGKRKSSSPSPASSSPTTSKPEHPSSALLSEPALPQTSNSHLEIRTTSAGSNPQTPTITATGNSRDRGVNGNGHGRHAHESNASAALAILDEPRAQSELLDQQLREQPGVLAGLVASWVLPLRTVMGLGPSSPRQSSPSLRTPGSSEQQRSQPPGSPRHSGSPAGGFGPFPFPGKHSQAEGSLRELLRSAEERAAAAAAAREAAVVDAKGKGVDRGGAVS